MRLMTCPPEKDPGDEIGVIDDDGRYATATPYHVFLPKAAFVYEKKGWTDHQAAGRRRVRRGEEAFWEAVLHC